MEPDNAGLTSLGALDAGHGARLVNAMRSFTSPGDRRPSRICTARRPLPPGPLARRRVRSLALVALAASVVAGCAEVVKTTPDEVSVETQFLGDIMPGARHWLGWLPANQYCGPGRSPQVKDLQGSIATYRCVPE